MKREKIKRDYGNLMIETFFDSEKNTDGSEILFHGLNGLIKPVYLVGRDEEREGS